MVCYSALHALIAAPELQIQISSLKEKIVEKLTFKLSFKWQNKCQIHVETSSEVHSVRNSESEPPSDSAYEAGPLKSKCFSLSQNIHNIYTISKIAKCRSRIQDHYLTIGRHLA